MRLLRNLVLFAYSALVVSATNETTSTEVGNTNATTTTQPPTNEDTNVTTTSGAGSSSTTTTNTSNTNTVGSSSSATTNTNTAGSSSSATTNTNTAGSSSSHTHGTGTTGSSSSTGGSSTSGDTSAPNTVVEDVVIKGTFQSTYDTGNMTAVQFAESPVVWEAKEKALSAALDDKPVVITKAEVVTGRRLNAGRRLATGVKVKFEYTVFNVNPTDRATIEGHMINTDKLKAVQANFNADTEVTSLSVSGSGIPEADTPAPVLIPLFESGTWTLEYYKDAKCSEKKTDESTYKSVMTGVLGDTSCKEYETSKSVKFDKCGSGASLKYGGKGNSASSCGNTISATDFGLEDVCTKVVTDVYRKIVCVESTSTSTSGALTRSVLGVFVGLLAGSWVLA